jgi:Predicted transcriptional regulators
MEKIGQIICTYRKLNGISQEELAGIVGVSAGAVSKWERDISLPDLDALCSLADYFQITVDELLGRKKEKNNRYSV